MCYVERRFCLDVTFSYAHYQVRSALMSSSGGWKDISSQPYPCEAAPLVVMSGPTDRD
ncbi:hypothetical protein IG631_20757 [Alternaria alternata]|nr:hypothetical protein IG631_20757 [Alternaria alternata]